MSLAISKDDHVRGANTAPVTILVYGDYECPYTRALEQSVGQLRRSDAEAFRYVFRYFPLREYHPHAQSAAEAAETVYALAGADAFWLMHDALFAHQEDLGATNLERQAKAAGVDTKAYRNAVSAHRYAGRVERDVQSGLANGVEGTPSIFINGARYHGARDVDSLRETIASNRSA